MGRRVDVIQSGTITGTVMSHCTGEPIAGADVRATPLSREGGPGDFSVRTDAAGRFVVEGVQPEMALSPSANLRAEFGEKQRYAIGWRKGATSPRRTEPVVLESGGSARLVLTFDEPYGEHLSFDALLPRLPGEQWRHSVGGGKSWSESPTKAILDGLPLTRLDLLFWGEDGQCWFDGVLDKAYAISVRPRPGQTLRIEAHLPDDRSSTPTPDTVGCRRR